MISFLVVIGFSAVGYGIKALYDKTEKDKQHVIDATVVEMNSIHHKLDMILNGEHLSPYGNFTQTKR